MATRHRAQAARRPGPAPRRGRRRWLPAAATVVVVALVVLAFLVVRWATAPSAPISPGAQSSQEVVATITTLPSSNLEAVGRGSATDSLNPVAGAQLLKGPTGKPELLFVGAEYCPYCAAERWAVIVALSRFGTFSGLTTTSSSGDDVYPNTPTFSFAHATYTSQYIDFVAVETSDRNGNPLQTLTPAQQALVDKYDAAPYTTSSGSIPFLDLGNRYVVSGATYSPDVLQGMSWQQVAAALKEPSSPQAKGILGSANLITAALCQTSGQQPASACSLPGVQSLQTSLGGSR